MLGQLDELEQLSPDDLVTARYERLRRYGAFKTD